MVALVALGEGSGSVFGLRGEGDKEVTKKSDDGAVLTNPKADPK